VQRNSAIVRSSALRRADEIGLELDRREIRHAVWKVHQARIAAGRIGERNDRRGMQVAIGGEDFRPDVELGIEAAVLDVRHPKSHELGQAPLAARIGHLQRDAGSQSHAVPFDVVDDACRCAQRSPAAAQASRASSRMSAQKRSTAAGGVSHAHMKRHPVSPTNT
jgi:hypothetical protein